MSESFAVPKISEKRDCLNGLYLPQLYVLFVFVGHAAVISFSSQKLYFSS